MTNIKLNLTFQILLSVMLSIFCAVVSFWLLSKLDKSVIAIIHDSAITHEMEENNTKLEVKRFQEFVKKNYIKSYEFDKITKYLNDKPYLMLMMYDNKRLIYDSTYPQLNTGDIEKENIPYMHKYRPHYNIYFYDKILNIEMVSFSLHYYFFIVIFFKLCIGFAVFLGTLLLLIQKKVNYIINLMDEVNILESGNLNYRITIKGNDEITYLAKSIDSMRLSILERFTRETDAVNANHKLVAAMSHDLRTPLTILIGFLEILENKKYNSTEQLEKYIHKSRDKAYQIKQMSDKLFEYFLAYSLDHEKLNLKSYPITVLSEIIEDYIFSLEEDNYKINYTPLESEYKKILIDVNYIHRVFANIFSNITKYADKEHPIIVTCCSNLNNEIIIKIENTIIKDMKNVESTNIGLETCKKIMYSHEGTFTVTKTDTSFTVTLTFSLE